jgi:hypothetical protein
MPDIQQNFVQSRVSLDSRVPQRQSCLNRRHRRINHHKRNIFCLKFQSNLTPSAPKTAENVMPDQRIYQSSLLPNSCSFLKISFNQRFCKAVDDETNHNHAHQNQPYGKHSPALTEGLKFTVAHSC